MKSVAFLGVVLAFVAGVDRAHPSTSLSPVAKGSSQLLSHLPPSNVDDEIAAASDDGSLFSPPGAPRTSSRTPIRLAGIADRAPQLLLELVNRAIPGAIKAKRTAFDAPSTITLHDVEILDANGVQVTTVKRVEIKAKLAALLVGDVILERVLVVAPSLSLKMENGRLNLIDVFLRPDDGSEKDPPDIDVILDSVSVSDGDLDFKDGDVHVTAQGVSSQFKVELFVKSGHFVVRGINIRAPRARVELPDMAIPIVDGRVEDFTLRKTRLTLGRFTANAMDAAVDGKGDLVFIGRGRYELSLKASAPADAWPEKLARLPFSTPALTAKGSLSGSFSAPLIILDVNAGAFRAYDVAVKKADAHVVITRDVVSFDGGRVVLEGGGTTTLQGSAHPGARTFDVDATLAGVPLSTAARAAQLDEPVSGSMNGALNIKGSYGATSSTTVRGAVRAFHTKGFSLQFDGPMDVKLKVRADKSTVEILELLTEGAGLQANLTGKFSLDTKNIDLDVVASTADPRRFIPKIPKTMSVSDASFVGRIRGPTNGVRVDGDVRVGASTLSGVPVDKLSGPLRFSAGVLEFPELIGQVAGGSLRAAARLRLDGVRTIQATYRVDRGELSTIGLGDGEALPVTGAVSVTGTAHGPLDDPEIRAHVTGNNLEASGEVLGRLQADLTATVARVVVENALVDGKLFAARASRLTWVLASDRIDGHATLDRFDLGALSVGKDAGLFGVLSGPVTVSGTVRAPHADARLVVSRLGVSDTLLGNGRGVLRLHPESSTHEGKTSLVADLTLDVVGPRGEASLRGAYAVQRKRLNSVLTFGNIEVSPFVALLGPEAPNVDGVLTGTVKARGTLDAPELDFALSIPEVALTAIDGSTSTEEPGFHEMSRAISLTRTRGRVAVNGSLKDGKLAALACAFPSDDAVDFMTPCDGPVRAFADVTGDLDLKSKTYNLDVDAAVLEDDIEILIPALRRAGIGLDGRARGDMKIEKRVSGTLDVSGLLAVEELRIETPDSPSATLREPAVLRFQPGSVELDQPMVFLIGDDDVRVSGRVNLKRETLTVGVRGDVTLALLSAVTTEIQQPTGALRAHVTVDGPWARPAVTGCVTPHGRVAFTPRALGQRIDLQSGELCVTPLDDVTEGVDRVRVDRLALAIDDAKLNFDGSLDMSVRSAESARILSWNMTANATDLMVRSGRTWAEVDYDVTLRGSEAEPQLKGRVEISEGALKESFELTNFVVTKKPGRPSAPLHERLRPLGLEALKLDVQTVVTSFETKAFASSVRADGTIRGDLHIGGTVRVPVLTGAIDVTEGRFQFPYAVFDVEQSQIEFVRRPDGRMIPRIFLVARSELEPPRNGLDTEVPTVLRLDGDLEQMKLELSAEDTDIDVSQNALFRHVLFGAPLSNAEGSSDTSGALRAVSSELTSAFTRDIETSFAEQLGTDVDLQLFYEEGRVKGGVRYSLGKRVEIEGEAGLLGGDSGTDDAPSSTGELRLRLLLVDHVPLKLGRQVAFVGQVRSYTSVESSASASTDLRLTYRVFEF